jgi:hypothetical protein
MKHTGLRNLVSVASAAAAFATCAALALPTHAARTAAEPVQTALPAVYLRGSMNNWQATTPMRVSGTRRWALVTELAAGKLEVKVAGANWADLDLGAQAGARPLRPGKVTPLQTGGSNIVLEIPRSGRYRLEFWWRAEPAAPSLRLLAAP